MNIFQKIMKLLFKSGIHHQGVILVQRGNYNIKIIKEISRTRYKEKEDFWSL